MVVKRSMRFSPFTFCAFLVAITVVSAAAAVDGSLPHRTADVATDRDEVVIGARFSAVGSRQVHVAAEKVFAIHRMQGVASSFSPMVETAVSRGANVPERSVVEDALALVNDALAFAADSEFDEQTIFSSRFSPGNSPGILTIANQTFFTSESVLTMEIGGLAPGPGVPVDNGYDQIIFTSPSTPQVTWGGTLVIDLINNFEPQPGQIFNLFDFDSARSAGTFGSISVLDHGWLDPRYSFDFSQLYTTGIVSVIPEPNSAAILGWAAAFVFGSRTVRRRPVVIER
jgi:hypothetical protein